MPTIPRDRPNLGATTPLTGSSTVSSTVPTPTATTTTRTSPLEGLRQAMNRLIGTVVPARAAPTEPSLIAAREAHNALYLLGLPRNPPDFGALRTLFDSKSPDEMRALRRAYRQEYRRDLDLELRIRRATLAPALQLVLRPQYDRVIAASMGRASSSSELGQRVAQAIWSADHNEGTVPTENLYSTKNAATGVFVNAREIFPAMRDLIASARHEVMLESFEWYPMYFKKEPGWENDPTMVTLDGLSQLQDRIKREQAEGKNPPVPVKVYFSIDGRHRNANEQVGPLAVNKTRNLLRQLASLGLDPSLVEVHVGAHERQAWGALHSKALVVDGYKAMVTGANHQTFNMFYSSWHDIAYGIKGEAAIGLARNFDDTWKETTEITSVQNLDADREVDAIVTGQPTRPIDHHPAALEPDLDQDPDLARASLPVALANRRSMDPLKTGLDVLGVDNPQSQAMLSMVRNAKRSINIESPNMNNEPMMNELIEAARRGVEVRVILSLGFNSWAERKTIGPISMGGANEDVVLALYKKISDPAVRRRIHISWNSADGQKPTWVQEPGASHAKYLTVDGQTAVVGSANQDNISWYLARESNLFVDSAQVTREYDQRVFEPDWDKGIDAIDFARRIVTDGGKLSYWDDNRNAEVERLLGNSVDWANQLIQAYEA